MVAASYESSATADTKPGDGGVPTLRGGGGVAIGAGGGGGGGGLTSAGAGGSGDGLTAASFCLAPDRLFEDLDVEDLPDKELREMFLDDRRLEPD